MHSIILFLQKAKRKLGEGEKERQKVLFFIFSERKCNISLRFWAIRPSEFFGARRKVVLRGEGNAWVLVLGVFDKLREVEVLSYLSFTLCLSVFMMFELIEAVSGRLIDPKFWNQIVGKF